MTAKKFFAEFQAKLVTHLKTHRPEGLKELGEDDINIGSFEQVLAVMSAFMNRDAKIDDDIKTAKRQLQEMAEQYGLTDEEIEAIEDGDGGEH